MPLREETATKKKFERSEEAKYPATQKGRIHADPITVRGPIPVSSAATNALATPFLFQKEPTAERRRGMVSVVQIHPLPQADRTLELRTAARTFLTL